MAVRSKRLGICFAVALATLAAANPAHAGYVERLDEYRSQYVHYYETTGSGVAAATNETGNNVGLNATAELLAVSVQCNGYGQSCVQHAAKRIYPIILSYSYRTVDAGNPYSAGHTYKACVSTKTSFSNSYYDWNYLNQCTNLTT